jgi:hypothetical protein
LSADISYFEIFTSPLVHIKKKITSTKVRVEEQFKEAVDNLVNNLVGVGGKGRRSVDNPIQEDLFGDIFPIMTSKKPRGVTTPPAHLHLPPYRVVRSTRRKRNAVAFRKSGIIEIHVPSRTTKEDEARLIPELISQVLSNESAREMGVEGLWQMAREIKDAHLPELDALPATIEWKKMNERWGSCTPVDRSIRISHRLSLAPGYVIRSVLFHELVHLLVANHGPEFTSYLARNPDQERSEAFLEGFEYSTAHNDPTSDLYASEAKKPPKLPKMA